MNLVEKLLIPEVPIDASKGADVATGADEYDAIILGGGISGLVGASVLLQQGNKRILIIDEYANVGGNHIDQTVGPFTFDIGSLIFQDDSPLLAHFPEILPKYVPINPSWGRLNPQGLITRYPISVRQDIIAAGPMEWCRILGSLLRARLFDRNITSAETFARYWIGARLLNRSGLGKYMERFYGLPADKIDVRFAESRMKWIREHAMVRTYLRRGWNRLTPSRQRVPPNQQLARPRDGFHHLYQGAVSRLEAAGATLLLGIKVISVVKESEEHGRLVVTHSKGSAKAARVISTIPIVNAQQLCNLPVRSALRSVTMFSLFFSFAGDRGFKDPVLYNFSHDGAWKRLTVYSDFYGVADGREFFTVEVNANSTCDSVESAESDFRQHASRNNLFTGDLKLEGSHVLANAYPIFTHGSMESAQEGITSLRALGVESFGRQGGFDYQPTARETTLKAERALAS